MKIFCIWCYLKARTPHSLHHQPQLENERDRQRREIEGNLSWKANRNYESYPLSSSPIAQSEPVHRDEAVCLSLSGPHQ